MLRKTDFVERRDIDKKTGFITHKVYLGKSMKNTTTPDEALTKEIEAQVKNDLIVDWNILIFSEIRESLQELRQKIMNDENNGSSLGADISNIMNLCQVQKDEK